MKIVIFGDNHGQWNFKVPFGDAIISTGDFSMFGYSKEIREFNNWLGEQPHKHKLYIWGNHEVYAEGMEKHFEEMIPNGKCIHNRVIEIEGLKIMGCSFTPKFGNWAFMRDAETLERYWKLAPTDVDILISHGPPHTILDQVNLDSWHLGGTSLLDYVKRAQPKIHCFGHIHNSGPRQRKIGNTLFVNASLTDERYALIGEPVVVEI